MFANMELFWLSLYVMLLIGQIICLIKLAIEYCNNGSLDLSILSTMFLGISLIIDFHV